MKLHYLKLPVLLNLSPLEKFLLRKCEIYPIKNPKETDLNATLKSVHDTQIRTHNPEEIKKQLFANTVFWNLSNKLYISFALSKEATESSLPYRKITFTFIGSVLRLNLYIDSCLLKQENFLLRVWITKLLNQDIRNYVFDELNT